MVRVERELRLRKGIEMETNKQKAIRFSGYGGILLAVVTIINCTIESGILGTLR